MKKYDVLIEDGIVFLREYKYEKCISVEDFAKSIVSRSSSFETKQLPPNCVKYIRSKSQETYLVHIPEDYYNLRDRDKIYTVRLPHTVFIFPFGVDSTALVQDVRVSWTFDEVLDVFAETFFSPPMQNVYTDTTKVVAGICINTPEGFKSQEDYIRKFLDNFFLHTFNLDMARGKVTIAEVSAKQKALLKEGKTPHEVLMAWIPAANMDRFRRGALSW